MRKSELRSKDGEGSPKREPRHNVDVVNKVTDQDQPTEITFNDASEVTRTLLGNDAYTIADMIEGTNKFGTSPIRNAYFCMSNTDMTHSLNQTANFQHASTYPNQASLLSSEFGSLGNLRFFVSSVGSKNLIASTLGNTVYNNFCVGMEAYACIKQDGYSAQFLYRAPIFTGPLALYGEAGFRFAEVPRILNDLWIVNLRTTMNA